MSDARDEYRREQWLRWRKGGIGASDAAAVLGLSTWTSPYSLWASKVGLLPDSPSSERQRIGLLLEPALAALFHARTGLYVVGEQTQCTHPEHPWARATVDGLVVESSESSEDDAIGVVEFKTDAAPGWAAIPVAYRAQVIWQMNVAGVSHGWVAVLHGGFRFEVYEVARDESADADWRLMFDAADRFWREHVLTGDPPEIDGSESTHRTLEAMYPEHMPGTRIALDPLADEIAERSLLKTQAKAVQARLDEIENAMRQLLADNELGTLDGVPVVSYRWSEQHRVDADAVRAEHGTKFDKVTRVRALRAASKKDKENAA